MDYLNAKVEVSAGLEITSASCRSGSNPDLGGEGYVPATHKKQKPPATRGVAGGFCLYKYLPHQAAVTFCANKT